MILLVRLIVFITAMTIFMQFGCKESGPVEPPVNPPQPLPDDLALFASIDGNWCGIQVFNANSLEKIDSLETTPGVPFCIEFSPDYSKWYTIWSDNNNNYVLYTINAKTKAIIRSINVEGWFLRFNGWYFHMLKKKNLLLTTAGKLRIWDANNLDLIQEDSLGMILRLENSPDEKKLYVLYKTKNYSTLSGIDGIYVYNLETYKKENKIVLTSDSLKQISMQASDIAISPDGKYLFVTVFNWVGGGGYGTFHVVDLNSQKVIGEYLCGKFSQMGVSPDGRYVYISDPAGYLYQMIPTGHLLRYDITHKTMELFIDWVPYNLTGGAWYGKLPTDQIVIAPDNRTMFITPLGGQTSNGETIGIIKIDINTKKILGYYIMPKDYRGYVTQSIRSLTLGKYLQ